MKKIRILLLLAALLLLTACATEPNTLFATAEPEGAVTVLYVCDGEKTIEYWLLNDPLEHEIIDKLTNTTAKPVADDEIDACEVTFPIYSMDIGTTDHGSLQMSWSNGYLYNRDGEVYRFKFDFAGLLKRYPFEEKRQFDRKFILCERHLALGSDGWKPELMCPVPAAETPVGVTLDAAWDPEATNPGGALEVTFRNESDEQWIFGQRFHLGVCLDDVWYYVPSMPYGTWFFEDIAYLIEPGGTMTRRYDLTMYGDLPPGSYRFEAYGLIYPFTVN